MQQQQLASWCGNYKYLFLLVAIAIGVAIQKPGPMHNKKPAEVRSKTPQALGFPHAVQNSYFTTSCWKICTYSP